MVPPAPPLPPSLLPQFVAPPPVSHPTSSLVMPFPANNSNTPSHHAAITQPCFPSLRRLGPPRGLATDIPTAPSLPCPPSALHGVVPKPPYIFTQQQQQPPPPAHMPISFPLSVMHPFGFSGLMGVRNPALPQLPFIAGAAIPSQQPLNGGSGMVFSSPWGSSSADQRPVFPITLFGKHTPPSLTLPAMAATGSGVSPSSSASHPPCPPLISPSDLDAGKNLPSSLSLSPSPSPRLSSPPPLRSSSPIPSHTGMQARPHSRPLPQHEETTPSASFAHGHEISRRRSQESSPRGVSSHSSSQIDKQREEAFRRFSFSDKQRPPALQDKQRPPALQDEPHEKVASRIETISRKTSTSSQPCTSPLKNSTTVPHPPASAETSSLQLHSQSKRRPMKKKDPPPSDCEIIDYGCEKRARGREYHNSSSDSDSGGSCSSGQDGQGRHRRCETAKRSSRRVAASRSNGSSTTTGSGKSSKGSKTAPVIKRRVPPLQIAEPEEPLGDKDRTNEGRSFVVSLTSNCHISTSTQDEQLEYGSRHGNGTMYVLPPALWKNKQDKIPKEGIFTRTHLLDKASSHDRVGVSSKWMDDIIEKSVDNFQRKIFKLNPDFSDDGNKCSITQNPMTCSVVQ